LGNNWYFKFYYLGFGLGKMWKMNKNYKAFTLIEILLVIAILSVLLVVVFASLRPQTRLIETRDAARANAANQILTAIHECIVDNDGIATTCGLTDDGTEREIVSGTIVTGCDAVCSVAAAECEDMSTIVSQNYMASLPTDPSGAVVDHTSYSVSSSSGVVTITACGTEGGSPIIVAR
jgi:prepilin-type N-terminal cleavage/methylation domain-containing protein